MIQYLFATLDGSRGVRRSFHLLCLMSARRVAASFLRPPSQLVTSDLPKMTSFQELWLPRSNITRVSKKALPPGAKIAKDAQEAATKAATVWISMITDIARSNLPGKKKTVTDIEVIKCLKEADFEEEFTDILTETMQAWRACGKDGEEDADDPGFRGRDEEEHFRIPERGSEDMQTDAMDGEDEMDEDELRAAEYGTNDGEEELDVEELIEARWGR
ncbi:histone-fold-containing protein [Hyaloraphidium curvatum]|nr:histone-fold-containing protein [Hyaloraphidium curvatum]